MRLWVVLMLVLAGIGVGFAEPGRFSHAFGAATLYVFLPPLLFEAAWRLDARLLLRFWTPVFALAVPGVFVTTAIVAGALALVRIPWPAALLVGAMVSATDPIAVVAIFRRAAVPHALSTIVQSEALLNDAMAVVVFRSIVLALASGFTVLTGLRVAGGALLGALAGAAFGTLFAIVLARLVIRRRDSMVQMFATLGGAYVVYFACDAMHASGIFAVISFGIALRDAERRFLTVQVAESVSRFWDVLALGANTMVFFLTGAAIDPSRLVRTPLGTAAALAGIVVARFVLAYVLTPLALGRLVERRWLAIIQVANARGALSLALALAIPASFAFREEMINVTFGVVLATLLSSALTVPRAVAAFEDHDVR